MSVSDGPILTFFCKSAFLASFNLFFGSEIKLLSKEVVDVEVLLIDGVSMRVDDFGEIRDTCNAICSVTLLTIDISNLKSFVGINAN